VFVTKKVVGVFVRFRAPLHVLIIPSVEPGDKRDVYPLPRIGRKPSERILLVAVDIPIRSVPEWLHRRCRCRRQGELAFSRRGGGCTSLIGCHLDLTKRTTYISKDSSYDAALVLNWWIVHVLHQHLL
jgi:hypothetical protein